MAVRPENPDSQRPAARGVGGEPRAGLAVLADRAQHILARQAEQGWGAKVIERLTHGWTSCPARLPAAGMRPNARRIAYRI